MSFISTNLITNDLLLGYGAILFMFSYNMWMCWESLQEQVFFQILNTTSRNQTKQKYYFPEASVLAVGQVEMG